LAVTKLTLKKCFTHILYVSVHWAADRLMRMVLLLMTITKSADYVIHLNCIEDILYKSKIVNPLLSRLMTVTLEVSYVPIVTMINVINRKTLTLA